MSKKTRHRYILLSILLVALTSIYPVLLLTRNQVVMDVAQVCVKISAKIKVCKNLIFSGTSSRSTDCGKYGKGRDSQKVGNSSKTSPSRS